MQHVAIAGSAAERGAQKAVDFVIIRIVMKKKLFCFIFLLAIAISPTQLLMAQDCKDGICNLNNPLFSPEGKGEATFTGTPYLILGTAAKFLLGFTGTLALLFVVIGGFRLILARGSSAEIEKGKTTITWAIIGVIMSLLSYAILSAVIRILGAASK